MKYVINFGLLGVALVLFSLCFPIGLLFTLITALLLGNWRKVVGYLSNAALSTALAIDVLGNVVCRDLLDRTMRKPEGYEFGNYRETISRALGKNKDMGTLTDLGRGLANLLNFIDPGHVERAAQD